MRNKNWNQSQKGKDYKKLWYLNNKKRLVDRVRVRYNNDPDFKAYKKEWRDKNKHYQKTYAISYRLENKEKIANYMATYMRERTKSDIDFRLRKILRTRVSKAVRGGFKQGSSIDGLGCSIQELKFYLEGKFKDGMTWETYGKWHIDHILPLSFFDLTNKNQFLQACHYTNLQPLWAKDNLLKSNKLQYV